MIWEFITGIGRSRRLGRSLVVHVSACLSFVLFVSMAGRAAAQPAEVRNAVIDEMANSIVPNHVPGFAVLAMNRGRVIHRAAYGVGAIDPERPVTLQTPFYIASTAKMFTAAAVLRMVEAGRVRLSDPIGSFVRVPGYARDVTIAQLLTHTSGLPNHYDIGGDERKYSNNDVLAILGEVGRLQFEPGSRVGYSNSGYVLLAMLVEQLSGQTFASFLEDRFFEPFQMRNAFIPVDEDPRLATRAVGYRRSENGQFQVYDYESSTTGAGGVYASLVDLESWYEALRAGRVLEPASLRLASRRVTLANGNPTPYGMGWLAEFADGGPLKDKWYVFAFGGLRGFRSVFQWYQEEDVLLVWLANGGSDAVLEGMRSVPELLITGFDEATLGGE